MKEQRFFYLGGGASPSAGSVVSLPDDETGHATRVLRLSDGDEAWAMDGRGTYYRCEVVGATKKACHLSVVEAIPQTRQWAGRLTLAIAPTKMMDRMEWMVEKAVEIGVDRIVPLLTRNSERTTIKTERLERIAVSAMKQSRKAWLPEIAAMTPFGAFVGGMSGQTYIAHCHEGERAFLLDALRERGGDHAEAERTVMIGPEGDFTTDEVALAEGRGAVSVSLGSSRLRTETAGLVAVHLMHLI